MNMIGPMILLWVGGLLIGIGSASIAKNEAVREQCHTKNSFIIDNQKYDCKPTGQWVE